jgi:hypothetical protein
MPLLEIVLPFVVCALAGLLLSAFELIRSFRKSIGRYWLNRYVLAPMALNVVTAGVVYAFLRYVLGVQSNLWLAIVTGLTFPSLLRGRFTLYRPLDKAQDGPGVDGFALTLDAWYRELQQQCYDEINSLIAADISRTIKRLRDCLGEKTMNEALSDHITAEPLPNRKEEHAAEHDRIKALPKTDDRQRQLAALMVDIMPDQRIQQLLKGRK